MNKAFEEWLAGRPECIQNLAKEFPLGFNFHDPERGHLYLLGYSEPDSLIMSSIDPWNDDYDEANASRFYVHAEHLRDGS